MSKETYTCQQFLNDPKFQKWVTQSDPNLETYWKQWQSDHPESIEAMMEAKHIIKVLGVRNDSIGEERKRMLWDAIEHSIAESDLEMDASTKIVPIRPESGVKEEMPKRRSYSGWYKWVAACAILAVSFLWAYNNSSEDYIPEHVQQVHTIIKSNSSGQRSTIYLPDGSKVSLAPDSEISYQSDFQIAHRSIKMKGEAFFEVVKSSKHPFIVSSENITTTALGTSFNINSLPGSGSVLVSLVTGKVMVEDTEKIVSGVSLLPGEQASYHKKEKSMTKGEFDLLSTIGWKEGKLFFIKDTKKEVFDRLASWYGVTFIYENEPLNDWSYSSDFDNVSLENVLKGISFVKNFDFEISGKKVIVHFNE